MSSLPILFLMVLTLGIRHGFDLDHLATIDAMTRTVKEQSTFARWVGFLFSLGHGFMVILISGIIGSGLLEAIVPSWLENLGRGISVFFLILFGLITLKSLFFRTDEVFLLQGPRTLLFQRLFKKKLTPVSVMSIGALFALSFDTVSQVTLFTISGNYLAGPTLSLILGVVFMFGMMGSDGLNGFFVSVLLQKADFKSAALSQTLGVLIALFSLTLGFIGVFELLQS